MSRPNVFLAHRCRPILHRTSYPVRHASLSPIPIKSLARSRHQDFPSLYIRPRLHSRSYSSSIDPPAPPQPASTTTTPPPPTTPTRSRLRTALLSLLFLAAGFAMAAAPAAPVATGLITPPSDEETLALYQPPSPSAADIDAHILSHPLAALLRSDPSYTESRPHMKIPPAMRPHNLTGGTLLGPDKIEVPPLVFQRLGAPGTGGGDRAELPSLVSLSYLGPALCGHPGIVHGGLLATLLDEGLARACFPALPNKVGVTASLKIDYRKPCPAGRYVVLRAETTRVEGRKAWVRGWIELLGEGTEEGEKLVEAEALFIEPKGAARFPKIYSAGEKKEA